MRTPSWAKVPSNFTREERQTWKRWLDNPDSTTPHKEIGSRSRPMSIGASEATVDELYERMVKRGLVAAEPTISLLPIEEAVDFQHGVTIHGAQDPRLTVSQIEEAFRDAFNWGTGVLRKSAAMKTIDKPKKKKRGRK